MLLNIYLGTTAISWITFILSSIAFNDQLKNKGYKFAKSDKTISQKLLEAMYCIVYGSMPVVNIVLALSMLRDREVLFKYIEKEYLIKKKIYMPNKDGLGDENEPQNDNQGEITTNLTISQIERKNTPVEEMSRQDKIDFLISERERLTNPSRETSVQKVKSIQKK